MNVFNLCVNWLYYKKDKYDMNYESINVIIFCVIWPLITLTSIVLNLVFINKLL